MLHGGYNNHEVTVVRRTTQQVWRHAGKVSLRELAWREDVQDPVCRKGNDKLARDKADVHVPRSSKQASMYTCTCMCNFYEGGHGHLLSYHPAVTRLLVALHIHVRTCTIRVKRVNSTSTSILPQ